jgi:hypothetical protein
VTLTDAIRGMTIALTVGGLLALTYRRWTLAFLLFALSLAMFWGYYLGGIL